MSHTQAKNNSPDLPFPTLEIKEIHVPGYYKILEGIDKKNHLHCLIALHDTTLGPALGGARIFPYGSREEALNDVLRLSEGMTKKAAIAELGLGGGKSVIIANPRTDKTSSLLHAFGRMIDTLKGQYIVAEDIGSNTHDMSIIRETTPYVAALPSKGSSGDPSRYTAWGVFRGIQATAQKLWDSTSLKNKKIALQGLGNVGSKVADHLFWAGAELLLSDQDEEKLMYYSNFFSAEAVPSDKILSTECDIFVPCAMGGIINAGTIPNLRCRALAGSANNQLQTIQDGELLYQKGILYAPDYVINAGGLINAAMEFEDGGHNHKRARDKVDCLFDILLNIYDQSEELHRSTCRIAEELAEHNLKHLIGKRLHPIIF